MNRLDYLPPQAALALYELLGEIQEALWQRYGNALTEQLMEDIGGEVSPLQERFDFDDELPF